MELADKYTKIFCLLTGGIGKLKEDPSDMLLLDKSKQILERRLLAQQFLSIPDPKTDHGLPEPGAKTDTVPWRVGLGGRLPSLREGWADR
jgi:hypothetical protein